MMQEFLFEQLKKIITWCPNTSPLHMIVKCLVLFCPGGNSGQLTLQMLFGRTLTLLGQYIIITRQKIEKVNINTGNFNIISSPIK